MLRLLDSFCTSVTHASMATRYHYSIDAASHAHHTQLSRFVLAWWNFLSRILADLQLLVWHVPCPAVS